MGSDHSGSKANDHDVASEHHHRSYRSAGTSPPDEYETAALLWDLLAGRVSSAVMRARSLRSQHGRDQRLSVELDALILELDGAFATVVRSGGRPPSPSAPLRSGSSPDGPESATQRRFCRWVGAHCPDMAADAHDHPGSGPAAAESLLDALAQLDRALPGEIAVMLGLSPGADYADGVGRLRWARHAADGPRCRSYRSACLFLTDADVDLLPPPAMTRQDIERVLHLEQREQHSSAPPPTRARA